MDVNCGTLPSPPSNLCGPYPALFPASPSDLGFYSHHQFPNFISSSAAGSMPQTSSVTNSLASYLIHQQSMAAAAAAISAANHNADVAAAAAMQSAAAAAANRNSPPQPPPYSKSQSENLNQLEMTNSSSPNNSVSNNSKSFLLR
jgi:hypothetical protein